MSSQAIDCEYFDADLGTSEGGRKILGRFYISTRTVVIDASLEVDSPRWRFTVAHEIGHLVLHRSMRLADSGVVTREGSLVNLELHSEDGQTPVAGSPQALEREYMLGAVSKVRFEPARISGLPVAVNMVWLVTQTTVHAPKGGFLQQGSGQTGVKKPRV